MAAEKEGKSVSWAKATTTHRNDLAARFKTNLSSVSEAIAEHERVDSVSIKHVDEAHNALARAGLDRGVWYRRPETKTAFGGVLASATFSMPGLVGLIFEPTSKSYLPTCTIAIVVPLLIGAFFLFDGLAKGRQILPPRPDRRRRRLGCWPWASCPKSDD